MRLKLRVLDGVGGRPANDVDVSVDDAATGAELIGALATAVPSCAAAVRSCAEPTLVIRADTRHAVAIPATLPVTSLGLHSGHAVAITDAGVVAMRDAPSAAVTVLISSGPDAPAEFHLAPGRYLIGRSAEATIRLSDPKVSVRHAWLIADGSGGGSIEVIDNASANGTRINGVRIDRGVVSRREVCRIGTTALIIVPAPQRPSLERGGVIDFNRSPRLEPTFVGPQLVAPSIPRRPERRPFPLVTTLSPLGMILGYAILTGGVGSMIFLVMMPLLAVGSWWEQRREDRRRWEHTRARFHHTVAEFGAAIDACQRDEIYYREREQPSPVVLLEAARMRESILWTRRPEHERFGVIRIGTADDLSRVRIERERTDPGAERSSLDHLLVEALQDRQYVTDVPLSVDLKEVGNLAVVGWRSQVESVVRAIVVHLATLYSPDEWQLVVLDAERRRWMRWLPHCDAVEERAAGYRPPGLMEPDLMKPDWMESPPTSATSNTSDARSDSDTSPNSAGESTVDPVYLQVLVDLVADRRHRLSSGSGGDPAGATGSVALPRVVVLVDENASLNRPTLTALAEVGPSVGVHLIWTAPTVDRVPAACRAFVDLHVGGDESERGRLHRARLGLVDDGHPTEPPHPVAVDFIADVVGSEAAEWCARWLSPLIDAGAATDRSTDLPKRLSLLDLVGHDVADHPDSVLDRWNTVDRVMAGLRCVIGSDGASVRALDLRSDGPHALIAGTTGAGKSEFLQTWIVAMALAHPPEHFTVLLVDYKGGSAFSDCQHLPHCVGLVTDLTPHLVARALSSLRAELRRRERLFEHLGVSDLAACEVQFPDECPPSLVIVVDEFAALVSEVPDFVTGVVDVAQRGRSLGLHLVLATQRPAGVITDQVRANTNLRVALRMADTDDSSDVIGTPEAAHFDPRSPGRAAVRLGSAAPWVIQVAYVGGVTATERGRNPIDIAPWEAGPFDDREFESRALIAEPRQSTGAATGTDTEMDDSISVVRSQSVADLTRLVATMRNAAIERSVQRRPWLPELADRYRLEALPTPRRDDRLVLGVVDRPSGQLQTELTFEPERDGHLVVLGGGKAGKSTVLRTIAAAAGWAPVRGGPIHVYCLQFGGRALDGLSSLPHVGAIVNGADGEHVSRMIAYLRHIVDQRQQAFAAASSSSLSDYRAQSDRPNEPRIMVLVDGLGRFRDDFEAGRLFAIYDMFVSLISDGPAVGVHLVLTANRPGELGSVVTSLVQRRLVLRLSDENDVTSIGAPRDLFAGMTPPGRGWCDGDECQVAVLGGDAALASEIAALMRLGELMREFEVPVAPRLDPAPTRVERSALAVVSDGTELALGLDLFRSRAVTLKPTGVLLVTGSRGSGVSTTVVNLAREVNVRRGGDCVLLGSSRSALVPRMAWAKVALGGDEVAQAAIELTAALSTMATNMPGVHEVGHVRNLPLVVVIENIHEHLHEVADDALVELIAVAREAGVLVIVTAEPNNISGGWPLQQAVRSDRRGVMLRPDPLDTEAIFGVSPPRLVGNVPPGRGTFVDGDAAITIQVALGVSRPVSPDPSHVSVNLSPGVSDEAGKRP